MSRSRVSTAGATVAGERHLWLAATIAAAWSFGYTLVPGSDLWWHVAAGRWMLAHGSLPDGDPFSFSASGAPWRNHEWLADVVFALWERAFGLPTLVYWKWAIIIATFALVYRTLLRLGASAPATFASVALAAALASPLLDIRPHLYSLLGLALLLHATLDREHPAPWLPILFLVWANLHAGVTFGLIALGILLAPGLVRGTSRRRRVALAYLVTCITASALTPHGLAPMRYALRYAFDAGSPFRGIVEWQSPLSEQALRIPSYPYGVGAVIAALTYLILDSLKRGRPLQWSAVALASVTLAMSLRSVRFVPLFAIAATLVVAPVLTGLLAAIARRVSASTARVAQTIVPALATLALIAFVAATRPLSSQAFDDLTMLPTFPVATMDFVGTNDITGNVFALYTWGGYVQLRTGGRMKVYIDGRADTVYPDEIYTDYGAVLAHALGWEAIIERSGADYVLWPRAAASHWQALLRSPSWRLLHSDLVSVLLVRTGREPTGPLHAASDSAYRRLADGWDAFIAGDIERAEAEFQHAELLDPSLSPACHLRVLTATARGDQTEAAERRARCRATFPYRDYLRARLGLVPPSRPRGAARETVPDAATSAGGPSARQGSDSRSP